MRQQAVRKRRRGATLIESVMTTLVLMSLLLGTVDLGTAVFQMHVISEAARQGARKATCQGSLAAITVHGGPWGPAAFSGNGNSTSQIVVTNLPYLTGLNLSQVTISVTWPDGNNKAGSHVTYQVSTTWTPMVTWIFGAPARTLSASSTMLIAH